MTLAIDALRRREAPDEAAVQAFIDRGGFPLV